ncbi:MAG: phenylalanine--tRNA ligase subunit beta [Proteobacteria bacterium]|nr:phenylalanine--tRNA ligase subunit beta [Pseudomonadota bacterium]
MKISQNWLNDFVDCSDLTAEQYNDLITTRVAEVDSVHLQAAPVEKAIIAEIKEVSAHPEKEKLKIAKVDIGTGSVTVVCGAPNCKVGLKTAYLPVGASYISSQDGSSITIEKKEIAGVLSNGVLTSEAELGLTADHISGVIELESSTIVGQPLSSIVGNADTILEIDNKSLTHRPDLWCHYGFARELSVILNRPLKINFDKYSDYTEEGAAFLEQSKNQKSNFQVSIDKETRCRRLLGLEIDNVKIVKSPLWLRRRLYSVDAGIRNTIVDLSNYVLFDIGQPNHTYDADKLSSTEITVRLARNGEKLLTLDGVEQELTAEDVVIANNLKSISLAGIMGGGESAVSETTKRLFLESANFDPILVRLSTKRHQKRTDSSNRFEKSKSPYTCPIAIFRYCELLKKLQPEVTIVGGIVDCFIDKPNKVFVSVDYKYLRQRIGAMIETQQITNILQRLGFKGDFESAETKPVALEVPFERATRDITIEDDFVEEIGRLYGYENIPESAPLIKSVPQESCAILNLENKFRDCLAGAGFSEYYNYSFMSEEGANHLGYDNQELIKLLNPVDATLDCMRTTLVPAALDVLSKNSRYFSDIAIFEFGRSYQTAKPKFSSKENASLENVTAYERRLLCLSYHSAYTEVSGSKVSSPNIVEGNSFFALISVIKRLLSIVSSAEIVLKPVNLAAKNLTAAEFDSYRNWMHPYRCAVLEISGVAVGVVSEAISCNNYEIPERSVIAEIDLNAILSLSAEVTKFKHISKYPDSFFEMSVVVPEDLHFVNLKQFLVKNLKEEYLRNIEVLSVYRGNPLKENEKSISVKFAFGSDERTLSTEEITLIQQGLIKAVNDSSYSLRA